jgi:DNA-binding MarR family transcriptional regulator
MRTVMLTPDADRFEVLERHDLTVSQVRAIVTLACADAEPLPGGRLAERLGISAAAISRALDGLVQKGFVERRESPEDRRVKLVTVTASGRELADDLVALRRAQIDCFLETLDPEQHELIGDALGSLAEAGLLGVVPRTNVVGAA